MVKYASEEYFEIIHKITDSSKNYKKVKDNWKIIFECVLKEMKFSDYSIKLLFENGKCGHNWRVLHKENTKYAEIGEKDIFKNFQFDLEYSSDRMSFDRLFRLHWLFNESFMSIKNKGG